MPHFKRVKLITCEKLNRNDKDYLTIWVTEELSQRDGGEVEGGKEWVGEVGAEKKWVNKWEKEWGREEKWKWFRWCDNKW